MSGLFDTTRQTAHLHLKNILENRELLDDSVVKVSLTTASDEKQYPTNMHGPDAMLASASAPPRGTQFRRWANTVLQEYLGKAFAMNNARLKQTEKWDYFDEWLARIRNIRASEKRFYQKVKDLCSTAVDYDNTSERAQIFVLLAQSVQFRLEAQIREKEGILWKRNSLQTIKKPANGGL